MSAKTVAITLMSIALSTLVVAQKIRFTDPSNNWGLLYISLGDPGRETTSYGMFGVSGDTTVAGQSYRKIHSEAVFREDTVLGRIYFRSCIQSHPLYKPDTLEHLYFDYRLRAGDTFRIDYLDTTVRIFSLDSVKIGGVYHRVWHFSNTSFIEGIGTPYGPDFLIYPKYFEGFSQLRCFSTNGVHPVFTPSQPLPYGSFHIVSGYELAFTFDNDQSCIVKPVIVPTIYTPFTISLSTNPVGKNTTLLFDQFVKSAMIQIIDYGGKLVRKIIFSGSEINIGRLLQTSGVYFYVVQDMATGQRQQGRFTFISGY